MLVLFDQGTPAPLRRHLLHHTVRTAFQEGWANLANGELLAAAESRGFEVFVTTDKNLRYQQDLSVRHIAVVVIDFAQWPGLEPTRRWCQLPCTGRLQARSNWSRFHEPDEHVATPLTVGSDYLRLRIIYQIA